MDFVIGSSSSIAHFMQLKIDVDWMPPSPSKFIQKNVLNAMLLKVILMAKQDCESITNG